MFTGIIEATGSIKHITESNGDVRMIFDTASLDMSDIGIGESIAVNGACLTVIEKQAHSFAADLSKETLNLTAFPDMGIGDRINLEKAMQLSDRINGHLVSGHIDGVGSIISIRPDARSTRYQIKAPGSLLRFITRKGSITVDGVSLTVNEVDSDSFSVNIIPHTIKETIFSSYNPRSAVNLEVDLIARYLQQMLSKTGNETQ